MEERAVELEQTASTGATSQDVDSLECSICKDTYREPMLLHCMHTFCNGCIQQLLARSSGMEGQRKVVCPKCRFESKEEIGVGLKLLRSHIIQQNVRWAEISQKRDDNALQCSDCETEVATQLCSDCRWRLCDDCTAHHKKRAKSKDHIITSLEAVSTEELFDKELPQCPKHMKGVELYCKTCALARCADCVLDECHEGHVFQSLSEAMNNKSKSLEKALSQFESTCKEYENHLGKIEEFHLQSIKDQDQCIERINEYFNELQAILCEEKRKLVDWLQEKCLVSQNALNLAKTKVSHLKNMSSYLLTVSRYPKDEVCDVLMAGFSQWSADVDSIKAVIEIRKGVSSSRNNSNNISENCGNSFNSFSNNYNNNNKDSSNNGFSFTSDLWDKNHDLDNCSINYNSKGNNNDNNNNNNKVFSFSPLAPSFQPPASGFQSPAPSFQQPSPSPSPSSYAFSSPKDVNQVVKNDFDVEVYARKIDFNTSTLERIKLEMKEISSSKNPQIRRRKGLEGGFSFHETNFPDNDKDK